MDFEDMRKPFLSMIGLLSIVILHAQNDSIYIHAVVEQDLKTITVRQNFTYTNPLYKDLHQIKLLNWVAAYQNDKTPLAKRKLEDQKRDLYFAKKEDLGQLRNIEIDSNPYNGKLTDENLYIPLNEPLKPGEKRKISLQYTLQIPAKDFTGYGSEPTKAHLKYFFVVPDGFEDDKQSPKNFIDIEETQSAGKYWTIDISLPEPFKVQSNLNKTSATHFEGFIYTDPQFYISLANHDEMKFSLDGKETLIQFGYPLTHDEKAALEFYIPLQLRFIQKRIGELPEKIFISEKFKKKNDFFGNDDIRFWKFNFQMFSDGEKMDMDYFSIISTAILENNFVSNKNQDHWIKNGLKTYIEKEYIKSFYSDKKLLGDLPENVNILGIKPLKIFHASQLDLAERYGLMYQYMASQNLDQKIGSPFARLSNFNEMAISQFETGSLFSFIADKMGQEKFDEFLKDYLAKNKKEIFNSAKFLSALAQNSNQSSEFLSSFINQKQSVNFSIKNYKKEDENILLKVHKNTNLAIPFKVTTETETTQKNYWFDTEKGKSSVVYKIPSDSVKKILINDQYSFPENNYRDNYIYSQGLFSNMKKIKLKFFQDIPNPEYNEIYLNPRLNFNAYDKVLIGLNFKNKSLFDQKFLYSVTPYYSTGANAITGSGSIAYSFRPLDTFFRSLQVGASASSFHYNYDLSYKRFSVFSGMNFTKNPRSTINRNLSMSYNYYEKDLTPAMIARNDYDKYHLFSIGYGYAENKLIHEIGIGSNLQMMKDFQKLSAEAYYRWEYAKNKKISFRVFGGYFFTNNTRNNLFDYGISKLSNYSFSYGLLGQSATDGILSQQYILAEGGFKSNVGSSANQWILSTNIDGHVWKWFNIYADAGMYKNKHHDPEFIWDSGVKVKVIPDFLEIYFPIQSSLGFEPSFKDYGTRIRYTLIFDLNSVTSYFRRGWF